MPKLKEIHLDGSHLEGGGQLLRLALSLSCLTGQPIKVTDIRGNRPRSKNSKGRGGGLKKSHTECVKFLAAACNATTVGMKEGSDSLTFWPGTNKSPVGKSELGASDQSRTLTIEQKTPGSIYLILQALLPYILFGPYADRNAKVQVPVKLRITGGTNTSASPSHEYATKVFFPTLEEHLGISPIKAELVKRGWSAPGTADLGEVVFEITPLSQPLPSFKLIGRGRLRRIEVCTIAHPPELGRQIAEQVCKELSQHPAGEGTQIETEVTLDEDSKKKNRVYALVVAEFEGQGGKAFRVGRDCLFDGRDKVNSETLGSTIANKLIRQIKDEIELGGAVDEHMQDQLIVFQALANGMSNVERQEPSLHAQTAQWVSERLLKGSKLRFENGTCKGISFQGGGTSQA